MFFFLLMVAGNDSTRSVFTSGMKSLMDDPEQMELVRPVRYLSNRLSRSSVRFHPAFAYMRRTATRDTELKGRQIKAGDKLALWYVSGNRDESVFENPDYFDVRRQPNSHQGFGGGGRHFCPAPACPPRAEALDRREPSGASTRSRSTVNAIASAHLPEPVAHHAREAQLELSASEMPVLGEDHRGL